jgi:hypothetical protein
VQSKLENLEAEGRSAHPSKPTFLRAARASGASTSDMCADLFCKARTDRWIRRNDNGRTPMLSLR